jgi:hypothetical protein
MLIVITSPAENVGPPSGGECTTPQSLRKCDKAATRIHTMKRSSVFIGPRIVLPPALLDPSGLKFVALCDPYLLVMSLVHAIPVEETLIAFSEDPQPSPLHLCNCNYVIVKVISRQFTSYE